LFSEQLLLYSSSVFSPHPVGLIMAEDPNSFAARSRAAYNALGPGGGGGGQAPPPPYNNGVAGGGPPAYRPAMGAPPQPQVQTSWIPPAATTYNASPQPSFAPVVATRSPAAAAAKSKFVMDQQLKALSQVKHRLGQEAYAMKRSMDQPVSNDGSVAAARGLDATISSTLDHCVNMLTELAQSSDHISPKQYYEIHMFVSTQMQFVEEYFENLPEDSGDNVVTPNDLYEIVQYCPKVLQRSYLMVAAGSALLKTKSHENPSNDANDSVTETNPDTAAVGGGGTFAAMSDAIMAAKKAEKETMENEATSSDTLANYTQKEQNDLTQHVLDELMETVKGVQCPLRGLFLRHYLLQALKDKLPDNNIYGDDISISHQFILKNFDEMNRLWIRIQHMPGAVVKGEKKRRERERSELRLLVGSNLERLSQLEGVTLQIYQSTVLPHVLQQVTDCNDTLAQAYLLDCTIQVFPDHFHLPTLEALLSVLPLLKEKVNVRNILQNIMDWILSGNTNKDG
jgi:hypothetical protein